MRIAVATDHAGYEALTQLKQFISELGHEVVDFGPKEYDAADDYPDFMFPASRAVAAKDCDRGIILGLSGQGEAMAANRIKGVRCALFYSPAAPKVPLGADGVVSDDPYEIVKLSRLHNDANMLSLSGGFLSVEEMKRAIELWLNTPFSNQERHLRRINKLDEN